MPSFQDLTLKILKDAVQPYFWTFKTLNISSGILWIVLIFWESLLIKNYENKWGTIKDPFENFVSLDIIEDLRSVSTGRSLNNFSINEIIKGRISTLSRKLLFQKIFYLQKSLLRRNLKTPFFSVQILTNLNRDHFCWMRCGCECQCELIKSIAARSPHPHLMRSVTGSKRVVVARDLL
jgi:hypothetical protein